MQYSATLRNLADDRIAIAIAVVGAGLAVSLFYTPLPLIVLIGVPFCIYFVTRPYELLLVMVFLIPFNFVYKFGPVPVAAELLKVAAWIPFLLTRGERQGFVGSRLNKWLAVIAVIIFLSLIRARDLPFTVKECVRLGSNLGLVYLCINLVDTREKVLQVFRIITVSTFLVAIYGFYQWIIQDYGALFWIVNPRLDTSLAHYRDYFWQWRHRIISVLTSEMELGHYFNLCLPVGIALWLTEGRKRLRSKWLWMSISMFAGLVLTFTFGAWLALVATAGLAILLFGGKKKLKVLFWSTVAFVAFASWLALGPLHEVIENKVVGTAIGSLAWDAATRLYGWKLALQVWWSHPLIGAGIGNFEFVSADYDFVLGAQSQGSSPHETFLYLLANYGLVGTIAVVAVMVGAIKSGIRTMRDDPSLAYIGAALAFAVTVNLIGWFSDDSTYLGPHTSYLLWLAIGLTEVIRNLSAAIYLSARK